MKDKLAGKQHCCSDKEYMCSGSRCMGWRWEKVLVNKKEIDHAQQTLAGFARPEPIYKDTDEGYCGLAGRP